MDVDFWMQSISLLSYESEMKNQEKKYHVFIEIICLAIMDTINVIIIFKGHHSDPECIYQKVLSFRTVCFSVF